MPIPVVPEDAAPPAVPTPAPVAALPQAAAPSEAPSSAAIAPVDAPPAVVRTIGQEISNPLPDAPAMAVPAPTLERIGTGGDVEGILTVRGDQAFQVVVMPSGEPALVLYRGVRDQDFNPQQDANIAFRIPADAFMHTDVNATVKLVAMLSTGEALPSWLRFDPTTGRFEGTVPAGVDGELIITIKAIDMDGRRAETIFRIKLAANKVVGRAGLAEQLRLAAKRPAASIPLSGRAA